MPPIHSPTSSLGSTGAVAAGLFLDGSMENDDHARETGLLTAESFANSAALYAVTNVIAGRQRPNEGNGHGDFFQNNALDSSFPSGHATLQFSMSSCSWPTSIPLLAANFSGTDWAPP